MVLCVQPHEFALLCRQRLCGRSRAAANRVRRRGYSKSNSEATSAIAERHDAILAVNGDYYNYKDKNGLVIRNGVLYRDEASTRDQLLIMNDGTFVALPRGTYNAGEGQKYIDEGVVQSSPSGRCWSTTARRWNCRKNTSSLPRTPFASRARPSARWTQTTMVIIVADGPGRDGWSEQGHDLAGASAGVR